MPGAKLYNRWHLDGMNVTRSPTPREKKTREAGGGRGSGSPTNIRRCTVGNNKEWWTVFERYRLMHVTVRGANCCTALLQPFYTSSCGLEILFGQCIPVHNIFIKFCINFFLSCHPELCSVYQQQCDVCFENS